MDAASEMHTSAFSEYEATHVMDVELFLPVAILRIDLRQTFHSFQVGNALYKPLKYENESSGRPLLSFTV